MLRLVVLAVVMHLLLLLLLLCFHVIFAMTSSLPSLGCGISQRSSVCCHGSRSTIAIGLAR